jgi:hypothetical protein
LAGVRLRVIAGLPNSTAWRWNCKALGRHPLRLGTVVMTKSLVLGVASLLLANACTTDTSTDLWVDNDASGKADGSTWLRVYTCDGAVLDVNAAERRSLQFVIKDHDAEDYLLSKGTNGITPNVTSRGELIFSGRIDRGVFNPWDFEAMRGVNAVYPGSDAYIGATIRMAGDDISAENYFSPDINWVFRNCR